MKSRNDEESSLELLLDTMCNTFGGIVFITILVALITNDATKKINQVEYSKYPSTNNVKNVNEELKYLIKQLQEKNNLAYVKVDDIDIKMLKKTEQSELKKLVSQHSFLVQKFKYESLIKYGGTAEGQDALRKALIWLKSVQNDDGSWGQQFKHALTSLVMVSYLNYGVDSYDETFGESFVKAFKWILAESATNKGMSGSTADEHATLTFAIAELNKFLRKPELRSSLEDEVQIILDGQNLDGGFNYDYDKKSQSQLYVSLLNTMALRSSEFSGFKHADLGETKKKLVRYFTLNLNQSPIEIDAELLPQNKLRYNQNSSKVTSLFGLQLLGEDLKNKEVLIDVFQKSFATLDWEIVEPQPMFTWYCLSRAYFGADLKEWSLWSKKLQNLLVDKQNVGGFWEEPPGAKHNSLKDDTDSRIYNTSFACLMLTIFYNNKDVSFNNRTDLLISEKPPESDIELESANFPVLIKYLEETREDLSSYYKQLEETKGRSYDENYEKDTDKKPIWLVVKNKKLYYLSRVAHNVDEGWDSNFSTYTELEKDKLMFKDFKKGFPLGSKADLKVALDRVVHNLTSLKENYYLDFFVFDDSFLEFSEVKNTLKNYDLKHSWYPYTSEDRVILSIGENVSRKAQ